LFLLLLNWLWDCLLLFLEDGLGRSLLLFNLLRLKVLLFCLSFE